MTRNRISYRKKTHIIQKLREDYQDSVQSYFEKINNLKDKYGEDIIFINFDEVPIYYDLAKDSTFHFTGEKQVSILSHPASKHRLSACLGITSSGEVLSMLVVMLYKGATTIKRRKNENGPNKWNT